MGDGFSYVFILAKIQRLQIPFQEVCRRWILRQYLILLIPCYLPNVFYEQFESLLLSYEFALYFYKAI